MKYTVIKQYPTIQSIKFNESITFIRTLKTMICEIPCLIRHVTIELAMVSHECSIKVVPLSHMVAR